MDAQFFKSFFTQSEFKRLYKTLLPRLDSCSNCGMVSTCKACRDFINTLKFFCLNTTRDQWDQLCNFLYDLSNISEPSQQFFADVRIIPHKPENIQFCISNKNYNNAIIFAENNLKMYYLYGAKKYRYFQDKKKTIIHEFIRQRLEK